MNSDNMAKWQKELKSFMGIKRGLILEGNILDEFYCEVDNAGQFLSLDDLLDTYGRGLAGPRLWPLRRSK